MTGHKHCPLPGYSELYYGFMKNQETELGCIIKYQFFENGITKVEWYFENSKTARGV